MDDKGGCREDLKVNSATLKNQIREYFDEGSDTLVSALHNQNQFINNKSYCLH